MSRSAHLGALARLVFPLLLAGFLIVNPRSGDESGTEELLAAAAARGVETRVFRAGEGDLESLAREAPDGPVGIAGGDGSLAAVAAVCLEREVPFVCVPFGTRNHFARDLGLDRDDPVAALDAFVDQVERRIDVGWANGRLFLNNVSLGVYARLVHRREHHRRRREALARLRALAIVATHREPLGITLDGAPLDARVVLVANNAYTVEPLSLGERERLDEGLLHLYVPTGVLRGGWEERGAERFELDARRHRLEAAVDGEPDVFETPLEFRIDAGALRVLVPARD
jgi:diacylglycerol kinase family enzyme